MDEEVMGTQDESAEAPAAPVENTGAEKGQEQKVQEAIDSWEKDNRFKSSWKGDPNRLYKSYRDLEKTYQPLAQTLSTYGFKKPDELKKALEEYKHYKDPNNEQTQFIEYLKPVLNHDTYSKEFLYQLEKYRKQIDRDQFGSNLTDEELSAIKEAQQVKKELEDMKFQREVEKNEIKMKSSLAEIEQYTKEKGLSFNRDAFIKYCYDHDVPPHLMRDVFDAKSKEYVVEIEARAREEAVSKQKARNEKGVIPSGSKGQTSSSGPVNFTKGLNELLGIGE